MDFIAATIGFRRMRHATQALTDGADDYGARTPEDFIEFVKVAVSDEEHQELLARALTIAQDTAMRNKRRALGRALAAAASDTGTKVNDELLFIRALDDLDEPHIRLLRLMGTVPSNLAAVNYERRTVGQPVVRQWLPSDISAEDPGLAEVVWGLLPVLARHRLITEGLETITRTGPELEHTITPYGQWFLARLADPE
jgi:hypothetical protein